MSLPKPVLTFLKWLEITQGRDKLLRFVAYFSKFVVQVMKDNGISPDWQQRLSKGGSAIGQTRKLIRFFRAIEYTNEFLKSFSIKDDFERYVSLFKAASLGAWMIADHIQWLQKAGYLKLTNMKSIDETHSKAWLYGLAAGAVLAIYKLRLVLEEYRIHKETLRTAETSNNKEGISAAQRSIASLDSKRNKQVMSLIKNSVDMVIPAARLSWLPVSDGTVGLAGTVTSIIGAYDTWPSEAKK